MSRPGIEDKPTWQSLPTSIHQRVEKILESPVKRAARVWGGYSPTPTFRLKLANGSRAFFKGTSSSSTDFVMAALVREEKVYRELSSLISPWTPNFYAAFRLDDWHVLLLEDVGPATVPPWTKAKTRSVIAGLAAYHQSTRGQQLPGWLRNLQQFEERVNWSRITAEAGNLGHIAALAGEYQAVAYTWLHSVIPILSELTQNLAALPGPYVLLHGDIRSDNLSLVNGQLKLFDWPAATDGPLEWDLVHFAQSVTVEGGVEPEIVIGWYSEYSSVNQPALNAALAWMTGFLADQCWRPEIPGLPRLRKFQRQQLKVLLEWAARRFCLPEPVWLKGISV